MGQAVGEELDDIGKKLRFFVIGTLHLLFHDFFLALILAPWLGHGAAGCG
jgi:hypothetical protein